MCVTAKHLVALVLVVWRFFAGGMVGKLVGKFMTDVACACSVSFLLFLLFCGSFLVVVHVCFSAHVERVAKLLYGTYTPIYILFCMIIRGDIFL